MLLERLLKLLDLSLIHKKLLPALLMQRSSWRWILPDSGSQVGAERSISRGVRVFLVSAAVQAGSEGSQGLPFMGMCTQTSALHLSFLYS